MNIQVGNIVMDKVTRQRIIIKTKEGEQIVGITKSKKYLLPTLNEYGEEFAKKINKVMKIAVGIGDIVVQNRGFRHEKHLFVLIDSSVAAQFFATFLDYIRKHHSYEDDYVYGNIQTSTYHMVVIKLPIRLYPELETFKIGAYSKMFSKEDIEKFFSHHPIERRVLTKDKKYKITFVNKVNLKFLSSIDSEDYDGELDLPPREEEEIFNTHLKKKL